MSKYRSVRTSYDGHTFDSRAEAERYFFLRHLERKGAIQHLRMQVPFELIPKQKDAYGKTVQKTVYKADFVYEMDGRTVVEDVKGVRTPVYQLKKKLMLMVHGITITEVDA